MAVQLLSQFQWPFGQCGGSDAIASGIATSGEFGWTACTRDNSAKDDEDHEWVVVEDFASSALTLPSSTSRDTVASAGSVSYKVSSPPEDTISESSTAVETKFTATASWGGSTASGGSARGVSLASFESIQGATPQEQAPEVCPEETQRCESEVDGIGVEQSLAPHRFAPGAHLSRSASTLEKLLPRRRKTRKLSTATSAAVKASSNIPRASVPEKNAPMFVKHFLECNLDSVASAFHNEGDCVVHRFLRDVMDCDGLKATGWHKAEDGSGDLVYGIDYKTSIPADVPASVVRMCRLPEVLFGTTLMRMNRGDSFVNIVQHSYTHNVLYGERFYLRNVLNFQMDPSGGVLLKQWTDIVWLEPLPWTHGLARYFIEKKAKAAAKETADDFATLIEDGAA